MNERDATNRPSVTDSPWFWLYLFATAGLIAMMLAGNKFDHRQAEIEREFSARQSHGHIVTGEQGPIEPPEAGQQNLTLRPLYYVLAILVVVGWTSFYLRRVGGKWQSNT